MPSLLAACPGFRTAWDAHVAEWADAERGVYTDASVFVTCLLDLSPDRDRDRDVLRAVFESVERLLVGGDAETQDVVALGILENLQNAAGWRPTGARVFEQFLGPKTRGEWDRLNEWWGTP